MRARLITSALAVTLAAGCGKPPEGPGPTLNVPAAGPTAGKVTEPERKRAVAGKEPFTVGPIKAEVVSVKIDKPRREDGKAIDDTEYLHVTVRFTTTDDTVSRRMRSSIIRAVDEFGNKYLRQEFVGATVAGDQEDQPVRAGQPVDHVILVEKPIPKAKRIDFDFEQLAPAEPALFLFTVTLPDGR